MCTVVYGPSVLSVSLMGHIGRKAGRAGKEKKSLRCRSRGGCASMQHWIYPVTLWTAVVFITSFLQPAHSKTLLRLSDPTQASSSLSSPDSLSSPIEGRSSRTLDISNHPQVKSLRASIQKARQKQLDLDQAEQDTGAHNGREFSSGYNLNTEKTESLPLVDQNMLDFPSQDIGSKASVNGHRSRRAAGQADEPYEMEKIYHEFYDERLRSQQDGGSIIFDVKSGFASYLQQSEPDGELKLKDSITVYSAELILHCMPAKRRRRFNYQPTNLSSAKNVVVTLYKQENRTAELISSRVMPIKCQDPHIPVHLDATSAIRLTDSRIKLKLSREPKALRVFKLRGHKHDRPVLRVTVTKRRHGNSSRPVSPLMAASAFEDGKEFSTAPTSSQASSRSHQHGCRRKAIEVFTCDIVPEYHQIISDETVTLYYCEGGCSSRENLDKFNSFSQFVQNLRGHDLSSPSSSLTFPSLKNKCVPARYEPLKLTVIKEEGQNPRTVVHENAIVTECQCI